ncbi:hypothetical protein Q1695_006963 [Nippostrongylus brasiliensis]|nr:hypothetical protein Q1695_006963 [Nippostrongylus brasiliensis]
MKILSAYNKKAVVRLQQCPDLRSRYNVDENLRTLTIVFPVCTASATFVTSFCIAAMVGLQLSNGIVSVCVLIESSLILPHYALLLPFIFDRMIKYSAKMNKIGLQVHMAVDANGSNHHFAAMARTWDASFTVRDVGRSQTK